MSLVDARHKHCSVSVTAFKRALLFPSAIYNWPVVVYIWKVAAKRYLILRHSVNMWVALWFAVAQAKAD